MVNMATLHRAGSIVRCDRRRVLPVIGQPLLARQCQAAREIRLSNTQRHVYAVP